MWRWLYTLKSWWEKPSAVETFTKNLLQQQHLYWGDRRQDPSQYAWVLGRQKRSRPIQICIPCHLRNQGCNKMTYSPKEQYHRQQSLRRNATILNPPTNRAYLLYREDKRLEPQSLRTELRYARFGSRCDDTVHTVGNHVLAEPEHRRFVNQRQRIPP